MTDTTEKYSRWMELDKEDQVYISRYPSTVNDDNKAKLDTELNEIIEEVITIIEKRREGAYEKNIARQS